MSSKQHITEDGVFKGCYDRENRNLVIPDTVKEIGTGALRGCKWLKSVTIPETVTRIEAEAFAECHGLKEVSIPESVNFIGQNAFFGTPWLKHYPDEFVIVNQILLAYQGDASDVQIPEGVQEIGDSAFSNKPVVRSLHTDVLFEFPSAPLRSVTFPESLKKSENLPSTDAMR